MSSDSVNATSVDGSVHKKVALAPEHERGGKADIYVI